MDCCPDGHGSGWGVLPRITPSPKYPVEPAILSQLEGTYIDLQALFGGADPFERPMAGARSKSPATLDAFPGSLHTRGIGRAWHGGRSFIFDKGLWLAQAHL